MEKTQYGRALKEYLNEELNTLGDVETCGTWDETLGRKYAKRLIRKLFYFLEEKKPTARDPQQYT